MIKLLFLFLDCVLVVYIVDHGVNEGEPVDEQYCEQANEDQFRDPEPEEQYLDQDFPEGFENGKFNPAFDAYFVPVFINTTYWPVLQNCIYFDY